VTMNGIPVTSYTVECEGTWRAVADPAGRYALEYLRAGRYHCTIESSLGQAIADVEVSGRTRLDFTLKPWAAITGTVVDMLTGEPMRNIYVSQEEGREWDKIRRGTVIRSDERGRFRSEQITGTLQFLRVTNATTLDRTEVTSPVVRVIEGGEQIDIGTLEMPGSIAGPRGKLGCDVDDNSAVISVVPGGRAAAAGIRVGDVVRSINGRRLPDWRWDRAFIAGRAYKLELARGETLSVVAEAW
jgi:PDZ domain-containing protein